MQDEFDIYQTDAGYAAVTNDVRRKILDALEKRDRELPDLVKITGKSKATLSNLHVRELLKQRIVEELPHATDARRKVYRLKGRRIGMSTIPIDELRGAVKRYVAASPLAYTVPFNTVVQILLAATSDGATPALVEQARALGRASSHIFPGSAVREILPAVGSFWERESIARVCKLDLDRGELEVEVADPFASSRLEASSALLAGFLEGSASGRIASGARVGSRRGKGNRVTLTLEPAKS